MKEQKEKQQRAKRGEAKGRKDLKMKTAERGATKHRKEQKWGAAKGRKEQKQQRVERNKKEAPYKVEKEQERGEKSERIPTKAQRPEMAKN